MRSNDNHSPSVTGGSLLLVIFSVLCLTVFTLLAFSTMQAHGRLNDATVTAVTEYYKADYEAEIIFARIRRGEIPEQVLKSGNLYSYTCPISDTQTLAVEIEQNGEHFTVLSWQAVPLTR